MGCTDLVSAFTGEIAKRYGLIYVNKDNNGKGDLSQYKKVIASHGIDLSE